MLPDPRATLGKRGEEIACRELRRRGYEILDRRYRTRLGELDIVARDGHTIVFVEVKARRTLLYGAAREAITARKREKLTRMAAAYLGRKRLGACACRFDVVSVQFADSARPTISVVIDAFRAS